MKSTLTALLHDFGLTILAGFLGAGVSTFYVPGLTRQQQIGATIGGGMTASFVCWALQDWLHLSSAIAGGLSFIVGLVAFRATPALMDAVAKSLEGLPAIVTSMGAALVDRVRTFGGKS